MPVIYTLNDAKLLVNPPSANANKPGFTHLGDIASIPNRNWAALFRCDNSEGKMIAAFKEGSELDLNAASYLMTPEAMLYLARARIRMAKRCLPSPPDHPWTR